MKHLFILHSLGKAIILSLGMLVLMGAYSFGQSVSGTITDEKGQALIGATVLVKGTTTGTLTGDDGSFSIPAGSDATLVVSYIGFERMEVPVNGQSSVSVSMVQDFAQLDEVVVTGYGSQRKRDITASIASVSAKEITEMPVASTVDALKGRVAGVDIQGVNGRPGQAPSIQIRGQRSINAGNQPLFVVDGVPLVSGGTAFDINPQDIQSVEILKDAASTSIYGSRGANGVILITTKRGAQGGTSVSYDGFVGVTSAITLVDMMNGEEFAAMKRESRRQDANGAVFWNGTIPTDENVFEDPVEFESLALGRSTDYQDLVLNNGLAQSHQFGIRGGDARTQFLMSTNFYQEDGIIDNMDFTRYSIRVNVDNQTTRWLKIGTSNLLTRSVQNFGSNAVMGEAASNNPLGYPYEEDGVTPKFLPINDGIRTNPLSELVPGAWGDERTRHTIFSSLYAQADIAKGLIFRSTAGFEIRPETRGVFTGSFTNSNRGGPSNARKEEFTTFSYTIENLLTYDLDIGNSHLKVTGLQSIQKNTEKGTFVAVANLPYEAQSWNNLGTGQDIAGFGSWVEAWQLASFMGRVNYDLAGKYLIQANIRADGSSRLAPGNQWKSFPGISVGWRVIEESFMENLTWMQDLKLRASWGQVGNTSIDPYETQGRLGRTAYDFNEGDAAFGYRLANLANQELSWETTTTLDIGVDFSLWRGRLNGTIDWYKSNTTDLLLERGLIPSSGYGSVLFNVGETQNDGLEVSLSSVNVDAQDPKGFRWTTQMNWFANNEQIVSLGSGEDDVANRWFIGYPINVYYDFNKIGIWQSNEEDQAAQFGDVPGEIKLEDVNGNNNYDGDPAWSIIEANRRGGALGVTAADGDRQIIGSDVPDWSAGLTNRFEYMGFDLSIFFFARFGHTIRSNFHVGNNSLFARYNNLDVDYWTPTNPSNASPRPNQNQERPKYNSTLGYFDGDYVKLRNVTLGYNLPREAAEAMSLSSLRIYASAQNPWFWSRYTTYDPEVGGDNEAEVDVPTTKMYLIGVNIQF